MFLEDRGWRGAELERRVEALGVLRARKHVNATEKVATLPKERSVPNAARRLGVGSQPIG